MSVDGFFQLRNFKASPPASINWKTHWHNPFISFSLRCIARMPSKPFPNLVNSTRPPMKNFSAPRIVLLRNERLLCLRPAARARRFRRQAFPKFIYDAHCYVIKKLGAAGKAVKPLQLGNQRSIQKLARAIGSAHGLLAAFRTTHDRGQFIPPIQLWRTVLFERNHGFNLSTVSRRWRHLFIFVISFPAYMPV